MTFQQAIAICKEKGLLTFPTPPDKPISVQAIKSRITRDVMRVAHHIPFSARPTSKSKISPGEEPSGVIRGGAGKLDKRVGRRKRTDQRERYVIQAKDLL